MILGHLRCRNFRNYTHLDVSFPPGLVLFSGGNGQGKSSVLEAVYYMALLRSFRTSQLRTLRQWGSNYFFVGADLVNPDSGAVLRRLSATFAERRRLRIDSQHLERSSTFIHQFNCLAFVPEDIELAKGGATPRRRFLDILISQYDPLHLARLQHYNAALKSRNAMLREPNRYRGAALRAFDAALVEHGSAVVQARIKCVLQLQAALDRLGPQLLPAAVGPLQVSYNCRLALDCKCIPDCHVIQALFAEALANGFDGDCRQAQTRTGPHRDDLAVMLAGKALPVFGSEGQCRIASLALRLASLQILRQQAPPERAVILLIDDVLGELDTDRKTAFFAALGQCDQVFLAVTEVPAELKVEPAAHLIIQNGVLHPA